MSTPTVLPAAALAWLLPTTAAGRPRHAPLPGFLRQALLRAALLLLPVPLAVAASGELARLPWPVPVATVGFGWCAMSTLRWVDGAGARVATGLTGLAAGWAVVLAVAPETLVGGERFLAYAVTFGGLALFAALAVGLGTGSEAVVLRWSLPATLVAGAMLAGGLRAVAVPAPVADLLPGEALLPAEAQLPADALLPAEAQLPTAALLLAAVGVLALRAGALAHRHQRRRRRLRHRLDWLGPPVVSRPRIGGYLLLALAQLAVVGLVWRVGQAVSAGTSVPPVLVPLLVAVPLVEACIGWYLARLAAGLGHHDDRDRYLRYARRLGWSVLAALLPPSLAAAALAGTASRLPYGLSDHPDASALLLAMAGGVLVTGVVAVSWLLAARRRPGLAALVAGGPVLGAAAGYVGLPHLAATSLEGWGRALPVTVIALAIGYGIGLVLAAQVLFDSRSHR